VARHVLGAMRMRRLIALALASSLCHGGCFAPRTSIVAGAGTALVGGMMMTVHSSCTPDGLACSALNQGTQPIVDGYQMAGVALVALGAVLVFVGIGSLAHEHDDDKPAPAAPPPPPVVTAGAPSPAIVALRAREPNRLAIQASITARAGQCTAAIATAARLAALDPELYRQLLAADANLATCYRIAAATDAR
jgi:hypothetical protein